MQLQTIVYVTDMDRSISFYERLGFEVDYRGGPVWTAFRGTGGMLALHTVDELPPSGRVAISLVADGTLEETIAVLAGHGIEATPMKPNHLGVRPSCAIQTALPSRSTSTRARSLVVDRRFP